MTILQHLWYLTTIFLSLDAATVNFASKTETNKETATLEILS